MIRKFLIILILYFSSSYIFSQQPNSAVLKGVIYDAKNHKSVPYANILIWGTNKGAISDSAGRFIFTGLTPGYVELRVSCIGYQNYASEPILVTNANPVYMEINIEESQVKLKEVTIQASPFRKKEESPLSLQRIGIEQIERNPGGNRDISRVIQSFPGVSSTPAYRNDLIVRGGGSSENRFYLDGVEIPNLNHFSTQGASGGAVGIINVDLIREVNFYSGSFPADKGNALSSILDFKQIDGNSDKLEFRGSIGASDMAMTLDGPVGRNTTYIFSARRSYLQFLFSALGLPFLPTYNDFQFKVRSKFNPKNELILTGLGAIDKSKLNLDANKTESQRFILGYLPVNEQWNYTVGAVFRHYRDNGFDTWVLSRNHLNNRAYKYLDNIEADSLKTYDYNSDEIETKARFEHQQSTNSGYKVMVGGNLEYIHYDNRTLRYLFNGQKFTYNTAIDFFKWGVFGQVSRNFFGEKLILSLGVRADANSFSMQMNRMLNQLSPRFSVSYKISPGWAINGNVGRYFQNPPYTSMGFRDSTGMLINKINRITYIEADHLVGGIEYYPNSTSKLSVESFYKQYLHYPFSVSDSVSISSKGADFGTFGDEEITSTAKGRAYGLEVLYQNRNLKGLNLVVSYTFVRSLADQSGGKYIPTAWDNRNIINITGLQSFKHNWDFGFKWRYVGGAPYTPWDLNKSSLVTAWNAQGRAYPDYSRFNELRYKPYHQLDIRIDKSYYFNKWMLRFYLDVQNVYNSKAEMQDNLVRAEDVNNIPLPPFGDPSRYALKAIPSDGSGTILPTIGLIIQF